MTKFICLLTFLTYSAFALSESSHSTPTAESQSREDEIRSTIERSRATRAEVSKDLPQREIAAIQEEDVNRYKEFQKMVDDEDDNHAFTEIDKVLANGE